MRTHISEDSIKKAYTLVEGVRRKYVKLRSNVISNNRINRKKNQDVPLCSIGLITVPPKVRSVQGVVEPKDPPSGSTVNLTRPAIALTHERIAERARIIWQNRGCRSGEDERNWNEAETQLRAESGIE